MQDGSQKHCQGVCSSGAVHTSAALVAENATQSIIDPGIFRRGVHDHFRLVPGPAYYVKRFTRMSTHQTVCAGAHGVRVSRVSGHRLR